MHFKLHLEIESKKSSVLHLKIKDNYLDLFWCYTYQTEISAFQGTKSSTVSLVDVKWLITSGKTWGVY